MTFEELDGRPLPDHRRLGRGLHGGPGPDHVQRHGGRRQRGLREARRAPRRAGMTPGRGAPLDRGRAFTDRVRGVSDWEAPAPVEGWVARDVVRPPRGVVPGVPRGGAGVRLASAARRSTRTRSRPGRCTRTRSRPCSTTPRPPSEVLEQPAHRATCRSTRRSTVLHVRRLHAHLGPGAGHRPGRDARPDKCAEMLAGMEPMDEVLRAQRPVRPAGRGAGGRRRVQARMIAFIGRDPDWRRPGRGLGLPA